MYDLKAELKRKDDYLELEHEIEEYCVDIAKKFKLVDWYGRPRKAFILNTLMNNSCICCISKIFSNKFFSETSKQITKRRRIRK